MAWMPGAIHKPIAKHNKRVAPVRNRVNLHVAVSEALSLHGFFSGADVCSHFYVRKDGTIEQYIDSAFYSAADYQGNDATISVETQGGVTDAQGEPWTNEQLDALAAIFRWVTEVHPSIPRRKAVSARAGAESKGLSWHRLGVPGYVVPGGLLYSKTSGKICPGNAKIAQVDDILARVDGVSAPVAPSAPTPPPAAPVTPKTWCQQGDSGDLVRELQSLLNQHGYGLAVDGIFGSATTAATRAYQLSRNLVIDGIAGVGTFNALRSGAPAHTPDDSGVTLRSGSSGAAVRTLQRTLNRNYPAYSKLAVDGLFGPATVAVVKEFQRRSGLAVDGIVGPKTRRALGI